MCDFSTLHHPTFPVRQLAGFFSRGRTDRHLREMFIQAGQVESARVIIDRDTGRSKGLLNEDEQADYEAIVNTADIISILKLKVQRHLKSNGS